MANVLTLVRCQIGSYDFRLLWNGRAKFAWDDSGLTFEQVDSMAPHAAATILNLMGTECAAAQRRAGYEPDTVPTTEQLEEALNDPFLMPYDLTDVLKCIVAALGYGNKRDYKPPKSGIVDVSDLEFKKN